jgi:RsiW-degrading membrane proteinase PrsW (M82 family)
MVAFCTVLLYYFRMPITSTMIVAGLIATAVPLIVLYIIYTLDFYKTGAFGLILGSFAWGIAAFGAAFYINTWMVNNVDWVTTLVFKRYTAPIIEEILKAIILVYLVRRPNFTYFVDGAIYGFAVGIGFAIIENYFYIGTNSDVAVPVAISRVISTNLIHASASGMVGIAMGLARFQRFSGRAAILIVGLAVAMAVHLIFNNVVTRIESSLIVVIATVIGGVATGSIVLAIRRGLKEEKAWIEETLGMADRVTASEAAVVHQITDWNEILAPIAEIFPDQISDIEDFLRLQARLGIMRKTLEKLTDEKMVANVRDQMTELREEMDEARRSVGYSAMIYVRTIFPEDDSPALEKLGELIAEEQEDGLSIAELIEEELPPDQRTIMRLLMGTVGQELSYDEITQALRTPEGLSQPVMDDALEDLTSQLWLVKRGEEQPVYKVNLGRSRRRAVSGHIWAALGDRTAEAGPSEEIGN